MIVETNSLMTYANYAEKSGVTQQTIRNWVSEGKIKSITIDGRLFVNNNKKSDKDFTLRCPFCGGRLVWDSDFVSEDFGYVPEGKIVTMYHCSECGATGEFMEGVEDGK